MSLKVDLGELATTLEPYGFAYLVTVGDNGRVHVLAVTPVLTDAGLVVGGVGRHSQANATERPHVTLVWPPPEAGGFSLLVDGTATVDGETITVAPAKATLHRPAPGPEGLRAGSDCVSVPLDG
jgi:Pyridoxamine 5'-phosphate oxidase